MAAPMSPPTSPRGPSTMGAGMHASMHDDESAKYRRELLNMLDSLRSMGLTQALDLPQIVVIGSQSSGKSSLIESLCKIKLPRSTGTCTRCPIECRSHHAEHPWRARVFLRFEKGEGGERSKLGEEIPFGDPIDDPGLIEERIRQAQLAVLNPGVDIGVFLRGEAGPRTGGLSFTKNSVVVKITGRDCSDLIFVDLPGKSWPARDVAMYIDQFCVGIISSTTDEKNKGDIKLVQKLISSYMAKSSTINLIVITCESDYETQAAGLLAKMYDPTGERTIGVLTKPDRIEKDQEGQWTPLITGNVNPLKNGWFCVKQLGTSDRERGLSWDVARKQESEFFETAPGWSAIVGDYKANLGSRNLALKLGTVLSRELQKRLPSIRLELDKLIRANDGEMNSLPEHCIDGPRELVLQLVTRFVKDVERQLIKGDPAAGREGVVQKMRTRQVELRDELQLAAPVFVPNRAEGSADTERDLPRPSFLPEDEIWLSRSALGNEHTVDDVAESAQWSRTREWPGHYPFEVILIYMRKVIELWKLPIESAFEASQCVFERKLMELVGVHFSMYDHGGLFGAIKSISFELLDKCKKDTDKELRDMIDQEWHPESSHEEHYLTYEDNFSDYYRNYFDSTGLQRLADALISAAHPELTQAMSVLQQFGLPSLSPRDWLRIQPINKTQVSVLRIMASVRAHYQIAYRRFADKVKDTIDQSYVRAFGDNIENALCKKLGLSDSTPEECFAELTRESDDIAGLRAELKHKAEKLRAARIKLS